MNEIRAELAEKLLDALGQHLAGTVLASGALSVRLGRRKAPEARDAAMLLEMVQGANKQVRYLIMQLNNGTCRESRIHSDRVTRVAAHSRKLSVRRSARSGSVFPVPLS